MRFTDHREDQEYHEPRSLIDTDGDGKIDAVGREFRDQTRQNDSLSFGANAIWSAGFGPVENRLLAGYEYFHNELEYDYSLQRFGDVPNLSLFHPDYGAADRSTYTLTVRPTSLSEQTRQGAYVLEEATFGRLTGLVGVRFDMFEDISKTSGTAFDDDAVTWRTGLIY